MEKIDEKPLLNEDEFKETLDNLEIKLLEIINDRESLCRLVYDEYNKLTVKVKNDPLVGIFEKMYALDPEADREETESFRDGLRNFCDTIIDDWNFVELNMRKSIFWGKEKPDPSHRELISTDVAVATVISNESDMTKLGYNPDEVTLLRKLGLIILRQNKLDDTIHRIGRIGSVSGIVEPGIGM